jgi:L-ascorbate metabolism protein UlaG (beta-lactamase superfamily)
VSEHTHVRWLGHASVLLNHGNTWILTDPVLRRRVAHLWRRYPLLPGDWPERVDVVLISHLHHDHLDLPSLRRLGREKLILVPRGAGNWMRRRGFHNVREISAGDEELVEETRITATPALHAGRRPPFGPTADSLGFLIEGPHTTYFPGDTDLFPGMSDLSGQLDLALLPVWGWGPTLGGGHLDPFRAAEAVFRLKPRVVVPIHWGTFHPIGTTLRRAGFLVDPPEIFAQAARRIAPNTDVRVLKPGGATVIE